MESPIIIAGGRDFKDYTYLHNSIYPYVRWNPAAEIYSGHAMGADLLGELFAKEQNIPVKLFPAQWDKYGKSAGYKRNVEMAETAKSLVAFWDGKSKGTKHMIDIALEKGLEVHVFRYE